MRLRDALRHILLGGLIAAGMGSLSMAVITSWMSLPPEAIPAGGAAGSAAYLVGVFGPAFIEMLLARLRREDLRHAKAGHAVECVTGILMGRKHRGEPVGIPRTGHVFEHDSAPVTPVIALHDMALVAVILDPLGPAGTGFGRNPRLGGQSLKYLKSFGFQVVYRWHSNPFGTIALRNSGGVFI